MKLVSILSLSLLSKLTAAHFLLNYPPSLGFDDDNEGTSPCGGFPVVFNSSDVQVPVDGFPIALMSTHPEADWLFRVSLSQQEPFNWTNLLPVVHETGLGDFCIPNFKVPADFAGRSGVLQVMQDAADGELYQARTLKPLLPAAEVSRADLSTSQCATVNFVAGTNSSGGSACKNVTGLTATITNQNTFVNMSTTSSTASMSMGSATGSASAASPTSSSSAAVHLHNGLGLAVAGSMALAGLVLSGGLLVLF